ncbi:MULTISPECIES: nitrous oxide reductase family maturation protein NosD [Thalassospira]|jgi:nitrous oxidase accessory protein|uniref:Nitrous oxide reductase family maturation protein NosD n=2 Tax=Thalassospira povalilytica TaxID=732237 RepID=A0A8I1SH35_9PROT|nr:MULTISPECIES: nitrous oxide reductase family maturation protein NosD [Thalassospira]MBN8196057.1 nitrous oxide reductase family maturation protein NosD [Thalassospira povalilytica]MBO6773608.1 nitrous oxide reductase family maturation protein NosD [Thalassospira sp.]URK17468.1 nitrous oxide reductase family maturation protein NosD [Thalassospira sp. GO-4]
MMLRPVMMFLGLIAMPLQVFAASQSVPSIDGALFAAIAGASPGDVLLLDPGPHQGPITLDKPITIDGQGKANVYGNKTGSVITVTGTDIAIRGLKITGSGSSHETIDSGIQLHRTAARVLIENNHILGNLYGIDIHGAKNVTVLANTIVGRRDHRMNSRGNGIYVWNAPGTLVERNDIRLGRDGIFVNTSKRGIFRGNLMRDLRFAVHYMYAHDSEISANISVGNHLGFALMYSDRITVRDNMSLADRDQGLMLNYTNKSDLVGNLVRGTGGKCLFIYNAHRNLIGDNRFEGCGIGIHFTAGSERNAMVGNAFIANQTQVKYVGTRDVEWSFDGRGNFWSDHPVFDLDRNGIADSRFRPNDLMDHILWSQPAAGMLLGSPAVQLIRWSQAHFPATLPGGVVDSFPLMKPIEIRVPEEITSLELAARANPVWLRERTENVSDPLASH